MKEEVMTRKKLYKMQLFNARREIKGCQFEFFGVLIALIW